MDNPQISEYWAFVGTYTRREPHVAGRSKGVYVYRFDRSSGGLTYVSTATGVENPSFLVPHPNGKFIYSVNEVADRDGKPGGGVTSYAFDENSGELSMLNQQSTQGKGPCHLTIDSEGRFVLATNYGSGSVCVFPVNEDGSLRPASDFVQHEGSSVNPQRQEGPHAHSVNLSPSNQYAFVADLGMDKVLIYALNLEKGTIEPNRNQPWARTKSGAGPRHFAIHPNNQFAYVINELDSTITVFALEPNKGTLQEIQTISTLPPDFDERSHCADIHVHPSGKYVYGSNRGHDSVAVFAVDVATGKLSLVQLVSTEGKVPRNIALDPQGEYLVASNQNSDNIVVFRIDQASGKLENTGQTTQVPTPVCVRMIPRKVSR